MQAFRFVTVGVLNTLVGLTCIYGCMYVFDLSYIAANAFGYAVGLVISFFLNKNWTFSHNGPWLAALSRWLAVAGLAYGFNLISVVVTHQYIGISAAIAQIVGVVVYSTASFLGGRYFAFAPPKARSEKTICL
jgi:putative flippase GtrA